MITSLEPWKINALTILENKPETAEHSTSEHFAIDLEVSF